MKAKNIVLLVVFAIIITFLAQNSEQTAIKFLFWSVALPRWVLLGGLLVVGLFSGWIFGALRCKKKAKAAAKPVETPPREAPEAVEKTT